MVHPPIDARGRDLQPGDWVLILQAPMSVVGMPPETRDAFSRAIGLTLQILDFDEYGCMHLQLVQKLPAWDSIWLEPHCCKRSRRPKRPGRFYQQHVRWQEQARARHAT
jgi:hypothetical protein